MEKSETDNEIEKLKQDYTKVKEKHNLPEFNRLAEDFDIEKLVEKETSFFLRDIRRAINDKMSSCLHLFETLINPTSPPMFIFSALKNINSEDREKIKKVYKELAKLQFKTLKLDTIYNEEKEAEFVKHCFDVWQGLKKDIFDLLEKFDKEFEQSNNKSKTGYFG